MIAGSHSNVSARVAERVGGGVHREWRPKRRIDETVLAVHGPMVAVILDTGLDALPPRRTDILEETGADRCGDAVNVVFRIRAEQACVPGKVVGAVGQGMAAKSKFQRVSDDLLQAWRVAGQAGRQQTGPQRVGTLDFAACRGTVVDRVARECRDAPRQLVGRADGRIEVGEAAMTVQVRPALIGEVDSCDVVPAAQGDRQR